jgi:UDP-glucose 4-epimerase
MKVLITGILGLLGNHFGRYLLDKGYEVVGVDDGSGGYFSYLDPRVKFYRHNLVEPPIPGNDRSINQIIKDERPDVVCHYAAYASEGLSDYIKRYNYENNVIASINVINACVNNNVSKILFTSSMAVMGEGAPPFKESDTPNPVDSYGLAKLTVEKELELTYHKFGLPYSILRPHNVISPIYQNYADKYRNVLAICANSIVNGGSINVYNDGSQKRAFSDIKFMLPAMEKLLTEQNGEIFNIGSDSPVTILEAAQLMQKSALKLGFNPEIKFLEARTEVKYAYSDHEKAKRLLGFNDQTDLEQVIYDLLVWVKEQPKRDQKFMNYEINKNMYSYWKKP